MRFRAVVILCFGVAIACKNESKIPTVEFDSQTTWSSDDSDSTEPVSSDSTDTTTSVSTDSESETSSDTDTGTTTDSEIIVSEFGPIVTIVSPPAPELATLTSDEIITTNQLSVECEVLPNPDTGKSVDSQSVQISVTSGDITRTATAALDTQSNLYSAVLYVGDFLNGEVEITCTASVLASPPAAGEAQRITYVDHGPEIAFYLPEDSSSHGGAVELQFQVFRNPVAAPDPGANIQWNDLEVWLSGKEISALVSPSQSQFNLFSGTIFFDDAIFEPSIDGINSIIVRAPNSRTPDSVVREASVSFVADSTGPVISPSSPTAGEILGGQVQITATVSDSSGVDPLSVVATIAGEIDIQLAYIGGVTYRGLFDSRVLPHDMIYPNITIRAQDELGNQSAYGFIVALDNRAPLISLDPPSVRETRINALYGNTECSWMFDPLGGWDPSGIDPQYSDAANDGECVSQLFKLRARIEDLGNELTWIPGIETPKSGANPNSVQMFILDDETGAVIVDTNNDGYCDSINPLLSPSLISSATNEVILVNMAGLQPSGNANFTHLPAVSDAQPAFDLSEGSPENSCTQGSATGVPLQLCASSPATRIIPAGNGAAGIFTVPPSQNENCMGTPLDSVASNIEDGWICVAVTAADNLGNVGISAPLRVCVDHDGDGAECPPWGTITTDDLPDCTGTFDDATEITNPTQNCSLREHDLAAPPEYPRSLLFEDYPQFQLITP
ncbi:MAG: hypothetical protein JXX29_21865 [Deltaproteobacteria bacterium]|nr:hypothetical protein [Deltaproteobacteria bacterium]MBN2674342.1 hypothetical protein [Deltaproteobacteria bacterium]